MMRLLAVPVLLVLSASATLGSQVHAGTMVVPDFDEVSLVVCFLALACQWHALGLPALVRR